MAGANQSQEPRATSGLRRGPQLGLRTGASMWDSGIVGGGLSYCRTMRLLILLSYLWVSPSRHESCTGQECNELAS